jgi:type I restriction enzyme S subunit
MAVSELLDTVVAPDRILRSDYEAFGQFPIIDQGQSRIAGYTDDESALVQTGEYVVFGDHTCAVKFVDFRFAQGADGLKILRAKPSVLPKYLYFAICNLDIPSRGYNRHWPVLKEMQVPVPPIEEQGRIVSILDKFDTLVNDLSSGLPAEIVARRQQYEHYRDRLLTFCEAA